MAGTLEAREVEIPLRGNFTFSYKGGGTQLHADFASLLALVDDSASKLRTHYCTIGKMPEVAVHEFISQLTGIRSNLSNLSDFLVLPREKREEN